MENSKSVSPETLEKSEGENKSRIDFQKWMFIGNSRVEKVTQVHQTDRDSIIFCSRYYFLWTFCPILLQRMKTNMYEHVCTLSPF